MLPVPSRIGKSRNGSMKSNRIVRSLTIVDPLRLVVKHLGRGAAVVLIAPLDVLGRDRRAVVEFEPGAQPEGRALGVFGELEMLGERQMIVFLVAEVLDQPVVDREQEIVGLAVPSCCCGSSQREAILVCHASVILPFGTTSPAASPVRTNGIAAPPAAKAATWMPYAGSRRHGCSSGSEMLFSSVAAATGGCLRRGARLPDAIAASCREALC